MNNSASNALDNPFDFNNVINDLDDESITILAELLSIQKCDIASQKNCIKNYISSEIDLHSTQIKSDFIDIIENLDIIQNTSKPKTMINLQFLNRSFYIVQAVDQEHEDISIDISSQNQDDTIFIQIIPDGLLNFPDFSISDNGKTLEVNHLCNNSYLKLRNKREKVQLTLQNCPQNLFFLQILFYKKMTNNELFQVFRDRLNIPKNLSNLELKIWHNNHSFEFIKLIDSVQKNNSIICPICNKKAVFLYYDSNTNEQLIDYIIDDNEVELIDSLSASDNDHTFTSKYQVPSILRNQPSLLSLCAFFRSKKCFFSLLNFYLERNEYHQINKKDNHQRSPMHFACFGGDLSIVKELIKNNEMLECNDCEGLQPIHYAAMGGNFEVIKFLYQNELNMFPCANLNSITPLHLACEFGYYNIVRFYCEIIIPCTEIKDLIGFLYRFCKNKITPLHIACNNGQERIVSYFLLTEKFARYQIDFNVDKSPLVCACEFGSLNCVKDLLNARNVFIPDDRQIGKSFNAAVLAGNLDVITFLVKKYQIKISPVMILASIASNHFDVSNFLIQNALSNNEFYLELIENMSKNTSNNENSAENDAIDKGDSNDLLINNNESNEETNDRIESNNNNQQIQNRNQINSTAINQLPIPLVSVRIQEQQQQHHQELAQPNAILMPLVAQQTVMQHTAHALRPAVQPAEPAPHHPLQPTAAVINALQPNAAPINALQPAAAAINALQPTAAAINAPQPAVQFHANAPPLMQGLNQPQTDPSMIGYYKNHADGAPTTLLDLSKLCFRTKKKVKIAVQNISIIEKKNVHIAKSEQRRIVFKCIKECSFSMIWKEKDGVWFVSDGCFVDHTCSIENSKAPKFHSSVIDAAIDSMSLANHNLKTGMIALSDLFGENCSRRTMRERLLAKINQKKLDG